MRLPRNFYSMIQTEISFVQRIVAISRRLCDVPIPDRLASLKMQLASLNESLPSTAFVPLCTITGVCLCLSVCLFVCLSVGVFVCVGG